MAETTEAQTRRTKIEDTLPHFNGSENFYRHWTG